MMILIYLIRASYCCAIRIDRRDRGASTQAIEKSPEHRSSDCGDTLDVILNQTAGVFSNWKTRCVRSMGTGKDFKSVVTVAFILTRPYSPFLVSGKVSSPRLKSTSFHVRLRISPRRAPLKRAKLAITWSHAGNLPMSRSISSGSRNRTRPLLTRGFLTEAAGLDSSLPHSAAFLNSRFMIWI